MESTLDKWRRAQDVGKNFPLLQGKTAISENQRELKQHYA